MLIREHLDEDSRSDADSCTTLFDGVLDNPRRGW
jgi:hypothetical protein